jgi:hypothetical protein
MAEACNKVDGPVPVGRAEALAIDIRRVTSASPSSVDFEGWFANAAFSVAAAPPEDEEEGQEDDEDDEDDDNEEGDDDDEEEEEEEEE